VIALLGATASAAAESNIGKQKFSRTVLTMTLGRFLYFQSFSTPSGIPPANNFTLHAFSVAFMRRKFGSAEKTFLRNRTLI
jgi:hypothetical protein